MFGLSKHSLYLHCFDNPNIIIMNEIDLKKARTLLPYGAINKLSSKTGISQCDISRILNGLDSKDKRKVEKEVFCMLLETKDCIDSILSEK